MLNSDMNQNGDLLNSWKEISRYIGRGVRTVQRWEQEFGLPVRRPGGHVRGSVIALRSEIDTWLASRAAREAGFPMSSSRTAPDGGGHDKPRQRLMSNVKLMKQHFAALIAGKQRLRTTLATTSSLATLLQSKIRQPGVEELVVMADDLATTEPPAA